MKLTTSMNKVMDLIQIEHLRLSQSANEYLSFCAKELGIDKSKFTFNMQKREFEPIPEKELNTKKKQG
jgi:hypothetical protein